MAEGNPAIQQMAVQMMNPQYVQQQQKFALQQAMAQQMMQEGAQQPSDNQLANPGGQVIRNSPISALAHALQQGLGGYMANKAIQNNADAYASMNAPQTPAPGSNAMLDGQGPTNANAAALGNAMAPQGGTNGLPSMTDILRENTAPILTKSQLDTQRELAEKGMQMVNGQVVPIPGFNAATAGTAGAVKGAETANSFVQTPEGPALGSSLMGKDVSAPSSPAALPAPAAGVDPAVPTQDAKPPVAGDGQPLLPNLKSIPTPDPKGIPNYATPNTTSGVNLNKQFTDDDQKANAAFANQAQSLGQEKSRITNLINTYKQVQSGTLTAQDPEFFQKLAAAGFNDSPEQLNNLAGFQTATQNHILQILGQLKDTNANLEGGQAQRQFASSLNALLEKGESVKAQPQALWNILTQAQGQVDHHMDMMDAYQKVGGMGNRLNNGATMPADTFATQFTLAHPIDNYVQQAQQTIPAFKGMGGNATTAPSLPNGITAADIQAEMARRSQK